MNVLNINYKKLTASCHHPQTNLDFLYDVRILQVHAGNFQWRHSQ